jgi:hypothetical protein
MASALRIRVGSIRVSLSESAETPRHELLSRVQSAALREMISRKIAELNAEERADLAVQIADLKWANDDGIACLEMFNRETTSKYLCSRRPQQDYCSWIDMQTKSFWEFALCEECAQDALLSTIIQRLIRGLWLQCPSENTLKTINTTWLLLTQPHVEQASAMEKQKWLAHVKAEFHRAVAASTAPRIHVEKLAASPQALARSHPLLYQQAFGHGDQSPMPCPLNMGVWRDIHASYRCRGHGHEKMSVRNLDVIAQQNASSAMAPQFGQFGGALMQQMLTLQQQMSDMQVTRRDAGTQGFGLRNLRFIPPQERRGFGYGARTGTTAALEDGSFETSATEPEHGGGAAEPSAHTPPKTLVVPDDKESSKKLKATVSSVLDNMAASKNAKRARKTTLEVSEPGGTSESEDGSATTENEEEEEESEKTKGAKNIKNARKGAGGPRAQNPGRKKHASEMKSKARKTQKQKPKPTTAMKYKESSKREHRGKDGVIGKMNKMKKGGTLDFQDLLIWTKASGKSTRGAFTSKAYDSVRRRAAEQGLRFADEIKVAKDAYKAAARVWDRHHK